MKKMIGNTATNKIVYTIIKSSSEANTWFIISTLNQYTIMSINTLDILHLLSMSSNPLTMGLLATHILV